MMTPAATTQLAPQQLYPLDRSTQYGQCIAPLYDSLAKLCSPNAPISSEEWRIEAFPLMRTFMEAHRIADMSFTVHDQMLMMTDPVASEIRRVFNHEWAAQRLEQAATEAGHEISSDELAFLCDVANIIRCSGYSRFLGLSRDSREAILALHPTSEDLLIDESKINSLVARAQSLSPSAAGVIRRFDAEFYDVAKALVQEVEAEWGRCYSNAKAQATKPFPLNTDPGHLWFNLVQDFRMLYLWRQDENLQRKFHELSPAKSFMILEDNPLHQWVFSPLASIEGASFYGPAARPQGTEIPGAVSHRCFPSVSTAQVEIERALRFDFNLPNVVVADIELLDTDRNGLDFVEWLDASCREAGRREELSIVMVYSSNMSMYDERVKRLCAAGVINGAVPKEQFRLVDLLEQVEGAARRGGPSGDDAGHGNEDDVGRLIIAVPSQSEQA